MERQTSGTVTKLILHRSAVQTLGFRLGHLAGWKTMLRLRRTADGLEVSLNCSHDSDNGRG